MGTPSSQSSAPRTRRLVADAGGSNVRFAIADEGGELHGVASYPVGRFESFAQALVSYLAGSECGKDFTASVIAAAGPVDDNVVKLTNNSWSIDRAEISALTGGRPVLLVTDLEAVAAALPHLEMRDLVVIGEPMPQRSRCRTMLAANVGTGFGAATIAYRGDRWWTFPSEAGHMSLGRGGASASGDESELAPVGASIESVLSGKGIAKLYGRLAQAADSSNAPIDNAGSVFARGGHDPAAARTIELVTIVLGRVLGDLVLAAGAWGGVYLSGSVALGWSGVADVAQFRIEFARKSRMRERMRQVPTAVIRRKNVSLFGLAMMLNAEWPPSNPRA